LSKEIKKGESPNILIIITDDQGYADLSAYNHAAEDVHTPNMDRIAREGVLFTQAYVTAPVCSPSRAGWNTGLYQQRWDPNAGWNPGLPQHVKTIAEHLKEAGYITGKVGKNDYGANFHKLTVREYPLNHGFDEFLGFSSHAHDYFLLSEEIERRTPDPYGHSAALGRLFLNRGYISFSDAYTTEIFTDWAIDFLERHREEPFFLTVSYNSVHHLIHEVPEKYLEKFDVEPIPNYDPDTMGKYEDYYRRYCHVGEAIGDEEMRRYYLANLNCLDDNIGRILDALNRLGLDDNTLLIFFSDNGGSPNTGADNRPLRGSKYLLWEGGIRIPFMMRWPERLPKGKIYPYRISTLDILPTCLEAVGLDIPPRLDGKNILKSVEEGTPSPTSKKPMFWRWKDQFAVIEGTWKLVRTNEAPGYPPSSRFLGGPPTSNRPQLFNLKDDLSEQHDLYDEYPEIAKRLMKLYQKWHSQMKLETSRENPPNQKVI